MSEFDVRRNKLLEKMEDNSIALVFAGTSKITSEDEYFPFVVNRNFYYLTGITQENSVLMLVKCLGENKAYLFIDPYDPVKERWTGKRINPDEAKEKSQMNNVYFTTSFESMLTLALEKKEYGKINHVYVDLTPEIKISNKSYTTDFANKITEKYFGIKVIDLYPLVMRMRMIKSEEEIEDIREAIKKTNLGINKLIMNLYQGKYEYELADQFEFNGREKGKDNLAFNTIIASGVNATCLHYPTQDAMIKEEDLILFDLGYRHNLYCADISRTYPVNGKFEGMQKKIYEAVLNCNKAVISFIKEGLLIKDLQEFATNYLKNECVRMKIISPTDDIKKYYIHNVSHHLGLDTHDCADRSLPLEAGNVITVEPGLYFPELKIGVRIEDDVLITHGRAEVLSGGIIKEINDIEKMFKTRR